VFMDFLMPKLDGYACSARWRARERTNGDLPTPIVALTANVFAEDVAKARAAGMDGHLAKPFTRLQLLEQVKRHLRTSSTQDSQAAV